MKIVKPYLQENVNNYQNDVFWIFLQMVKVCHATSLLSSNNMKIGLA